MTQRAVLMAADGRNRGHQWAVFMTVYGQFSVAIDRRSPSSDSAHTPVDGMAVASYVKGSSRRKAHQLPGPQPGLGAITVSCLLD
jgi:hypothetical protein